MLKFVIFALLVAAIWYAFNYRPRGNWPPRDDRDDDDDGGPVRPASKIGHDPNAKTVDGPHSGEAEELVSGGSGSADSVGGDRDKRG